MKPSNFFSSLELIKSTIYTNDMITYITVEMNILLFFFIFYFFLFSLTYINFLSLYKSFLYVNYIWYNNH